MRRLLIPVAFAAAVAFAVPASADPVIQTCDSDDYTIAHVVVANVEVAHVCTDQNPFGTITLSCNPKYISSCLPPK